MKTILFTDMKKCDKCNEIALDGLIKYNENYVCEECRKLKSWSS